jgi:hypothetical protein
MKHFTTQSLAVAIGFCAMSTASWAGSGASFVGADQMGAADSANIRELLQDLKPLTGTSSASIANKPTPTVTYGTPTGYGANAGQAYVGYSGSYDQNSSRRADGSISTGVGFGSARDSVGLEVDVDLNGLSNNGGEHFGDAGSVGFKIHKLIPNSNGLGVALGWANAKDWGEAQDAEETVYVAATKGFELNPGCDNNTLPVSFTLGAGTGSYRSHDDIKKGDNSPALFGSAGIVLIPELSFATSWTGSQLNAGFGISPFDMPLSFSVGYLDVTDKSIDGRAYNFNVGYSFSY